MTFSPLNKGCWGIPWPLSGCAPGETFVKIRRAIMSYQLVYFSQHQQLEVSPKGAEEEQDLSTGSGSWEQRKQGIEMLWIIWDQLRILLEDLNIQF